ncbi:MAG: BlaI/MecI/CopY family transcriptional regulator [Patescibacteria group bacterium]|nr:BlaI/MecI/CopY family transcriptional regulator [Patescibacteria group bacterium]
MKKFKPSTIHLAARGPQKVLGEVESKIMNLVWRDTELTVRQVRDFLAAEYKELSFNAVMTIMNRLTVKKLLLKKSKAGINVYQSLVTRADFSRLITRDIIASLLEDPMLFSSAGFLGIAKDFDDKDIAKLKKLLS